MEDKGGAEGTSPPSSSREAVMSAPVIKAAEIVPTQPITEATIIILFQGGGVGLGVEGGGLGVVGAEAPQEIPA
jgi:hypothetical protein